MNREQVIMSAVDMLVDRIQGGAEPTEALAHVAKQAGLAPHQIELVGRAYNTGESVRRMHASTDPIDKSADFPIADPDAATLMAFDTKPKAAMAPTYDYDIAPYWYAPQPPMTKAAAAAALPKIDLPPRGADPGSAYRAAKRADAEDQLAIRKARDVAATEKYAMEREMDALRRDLSTFTAPRVDDLVLDVRTIHGDDVGDFAAQALAGLDKRAGAPGVDTAAFLQRAAHIYDLACHCVVYDDAVDQLTKEAEFKAKKRLNQFAPKPEPESPLSRFLEGAEQVVETAVEKGAGAKDMIDNTLRMGTALNLMAGLGDRFRASHSSAEDKILNQIGSPVHEQKLRDIETRAMLQDFLANDDVVKDYNPYEVTRNFNNLAQFAPRLANQPLMMEAMLRRSLQGPTDPFEVKGLAETEKTHAGTQATRYYVPTPESPHKSRLGGSEPSGSGMQMFEGDKKK